MSGIPFPSGPPPPPPPFESPFPAYYSPYGVTPQPPPPFYGWGPAPPPPPEPDASCITFQEPAYPPNDRGQTFDSSSVTPPKPPQISDFTQHALDTVEAAALKVANSTIEGLTGVKRKALATDLLSTSAGSYHLGWTSHWLTPMPPEILCMCKPLHCELCECHATSPLQAKMHYEGKIHDKHVRNFFSNWDDNFKNIIPQKHPDFDSKKNKPSVDNKEFLHCKVCDIYFTSQPQLDQHVAGRNHQRLAVGLPELKPGYYNEESHKWQRFPVDEEETEYSQQRLYNPESSDNPLWCDLCKVGAPSKAQMDMHVFGKSHRAKMKRCMGGVENDDLETIHKRVQLKDQILSKANRKWKPNDRGKKRPVDLSVFRTPSGQYYCAACNLSLNTESQFAQHQVSKKHKQKESIRKSRKL